MRLSRYFLSLVVLSVVFSGSVYAVSLKDVDVRVRDEYRVEKEKYVRSRDGYKSMRNDYMNEMKDLSRYRSRDLRKLSLSDAKEYFVKVIDGMVKYLELFKKRVSLSKGLSTDYVDSVLREVDKDIAWLKARRDEVSSTEQRDELRAIARDVRSYWRGVRKRVRTVLGRLISSRFSYVADRLESVGSKTRVVIDRLRDDGRDVSKLEDLYSRYKSDFSKANERFGLAKSKYSSIGSVADGDRFLRAGNEYMKDANAYLREAYRSLKEVVVEMKRSR